MSKKEGNMEQHQHMGHSMPPGQTGHAGMSSNGNQGSRPSLMVADFRKRFWISLVISIPILILSPLIQGFLGLEGSKWKQGNKLDKTFAR